MPDRISRLIAEETTANRLRGVIPVLARLEQQDPHVTRAYLCSDAAIQFFKVPREGDHFCAYRNIQMLLQESRSITQLQSMIEKAWDLGFNAYGKVETGGILNTRKHIGTAEAQALLQSLNIKCQPKSFAGKSAWEELLNYVEGYFSKRKPESDGQKVCQTSLSPIYLQRPRHSLTIIGIEKLKGGRRRLLVFDPAYQPPYALRKHLEGSSTANLKSSGKILKSYRRSERYLKSFNAFETLQREPSRDAMVTLQP